MELKFGSHVSYNAKNKYLLGAAQEAVDYGADAMMVYLGAPQNAKRVDPQKMFLKEYEAQYANAIPKENILVHAPYIVNPSSPEKHAFAIEFLVKEIKMMNYLGLKQLVLHPGAFTKFKREDAIQTLINSLKSILKQTTDVEIHLETMAGKGTEVGTTLEEIRYVYEQVGSHRIGVCLDTCHLWDSGYDLHKYNQFKQLLKDKKILEIVKSLHINDAKFPIGNHKDRHQNIGKGHIGTDTLKQFVQDQDFVHKIKVLETPYIDGKPPYKEEIALLKNK